MTKTPLRKTFTAIAKNAAKQVIYGWASVTSIKKNGAFVDYVDLQGDHISDAVCEDMAWDFCVNSRAAKAMHRGDEIGHCVASMPLTAEIQKAFNIDCDRTGWLVAIKVTSPEVWKRFVQNEFTGLSIGGFAEFED